MQRSSSGRKKSLPQLPQTSGGKKKMFKQKMGHRCLSALPALILKKCFNYFPSQNSEGVVRICWHCRPRPGFSSGCLCTSRSKGRKKGKTALRSERKKNSTSRFFKLSLLTISPVVSFMNEKILAIKKNLNNATVPRINGTPACYWAQFSFLGFSAVKSLC